MAATVNHLAHPGKRVYGVRVGLSDPQTTKERTMTYDPRHERLSTVIRIKVRAKQEPTVTLVRALTILDSKTDLSPEERLTRAAMAEVLEERHDLTGHLDATYSGDAYSDSYPGAVLAALTASGWTWKGCVR